MGVSENLSGPYLCSCGIGGQQPPIHVGFVPDIWIVRILRGGLQNSLHDRLCVVRLLQEKLDDGGHGLQLDLRKNATFELKHQRCIKSTYRIAFLLETVEEDCQKLIRILNLFSVLPNDPDQRCFGVGLIQFVKVRTQDRDDGFVAVRVFSENILETR